MMHTLRTARAELIREKVVDIISDLPVFLPESAKRGLVLIEQQSALIVSLSEEIDKLRDRLCQIENQ